MPIAMPFITSDAYGEVEQRNHLSKLAKRQRLELSYNVYLMFPSHTNTLIDIHLLTSSFIQSVNQSV